MCLPWEAWTAIGTAILAIGTLFLAGAALYSAKLTRVAVENQERVRPILTLTYSYTGLTVDTEQGAVQIGNSGSVAVRNVGRSPAFPLRVRIEFPAGNVDEIERFGVTAGGSTDLFGAGVDINLYDGALFNLTYGDVDHRQYESKLRCDVTLPDRFRWEA